MSGWQWIIAIRGARSETWLVPDLIVGRQVLDALPKRSRDNSSCEVVLFDPEGKAISSRPIGRLESTRCVEQALAVAQPKTWLCADGRLMTPPPDLARCEGESRAGFSPFRFGPPPPYVRCSGRPVVVVEEAQHGSDGRVGRMSLCAECLAVLRRRRGGTFVEVPMQGPRGR